MSRICKISGKGAQRGKQVSHAHNKTTKVRQPNLHSKRVFDSQSGKWVRLKLSSRIMKTISRKGLEATLRDYGLSVKDLSR